MLTVREADTFYGDIQVLKKVSLEVTQGDIVAVLGSNGAGKTTTLRTISGVIHPRSGSIVFLGNQIEKLAPYEIVKLGISLVPEGRELFNFMTVYENLEMGAYGRSGRRKIKEDIERTMEYFPILDERRHQMARTLSGGEQQMLAIARGLMSRPKLMLLDEPSLGLSPIFVQKVFEIIRRINQEGTTILLIEQNAHLALSIAEHGYVMENGKIVLDDTVEKLKENEDIKMFYLGLTEMGTKRSYRDVKFYKRRKRWLT